MKATTKYKNKLLLLGVLVALASMAVSMDVWGFHSRIKGGSPLAMTCELKTGSELAVEACSPTLKNEIFKFGLKQKTEVFVLKK